jgi:glutamate carboxypeptidase
MPLSQLEQRLCDAIAERGDTLVQDLSEHVAIATGRNHAPGLDAYRSIIVNRLTALGARATQLPADPRPWWLETNATAETTLPPLGDVVTVHHAATNTPRILIAGHLDTVHDPHGPFQTLKPSDDGIHATGPGVVDMKGGVLIAVTALEVLAACGVDLHWTVLLNSDEETGSFGSARHLREAAQQHDVGIAIEPALADGSLAVERMGSGQFMIEVHGQSAHVGREFTKGTSAVTQLGSLLTQLDAMADPDQGRIVNVGPIKGGGATNVVPDYAACWGNVRYANPQAGDALAAMIDALATNDDAMPRIVVHRQWNRPAKPLIPAVERFAQSIRAAAEDLGQKLPFASTGGVCDGNIMQDAGLPTLDTLGVRGGNLHRPDEFIELASLVERCQLLAVVLCRLAAGDGARTSR